MTRFTYDPDPAPAADAVTPILPAHIEHTIGAIARLHDRHQRGATPLQRAVETATGLVGRARFAGVLFLAMALWIGANLALPHLGHPAWDPPPFWDLQAISGFLALFLAIFILVTQRRENELTDLRQQLTLELALLSEQKSAKLIALIEELRVDMPSVRNRQDPEAAALSAPADPEAVLEALRESGNDPMLHDPEPT
jgi:uncharacterized membrane protein